MRQVGLLRLCQRTARHALGGGLAVLLFLMLQALSVSPHLHHLLHEDSHQPDHQCSIKLLSDGQMDVESSGGFQTPQPDSFVAQSSGVTLAPQVEFSNPPGRGPPLVFS